MTEKKEPGWTRTAQVFGNGDFRRGKMLVVALARRLDETRHRLPAFARDSREALGYIDAGMDGLLHTVRYESEERQMDAALELATSLMRFLNREHLPLGKPRAHKSKDAKK